jgi:hypothetical protein
MNEKPVFPLFVFVRMRHVELEAGFTLAGQLVVDLPSNMKPKQMRRQQKMITAIVKKLTAAAESGEMPDDAVVYGWRNGGRPANAVDTHNDALMDSWRKDRLIIGLRVDPRPDDGFIRVDSNMRKQMGLLDS